MAMEISKAMAKIQVAKNIILFHATPFLKNVESSLTNGEEQK